ncbi:antennal-enriched udp-glycosyltransferase [Stylonychia lemnae]|uniref:Antennal-enriched udp-glycosyltransferase n=1 Tax=Stylonychia lemnae TaxID=5949 RepID=A0A078ABC1_STYLE|nr:antennal-enriched udp-glycosyltransferase [Stylonychia lemnae]|eukprot:CDW78088.1 antennal-enriched udp-glycosyltransferase [Stylonychia lemnae]
MKSLISLITLTFLLSSIQGQSQPKQDGPKKVLVYGSFLNGQVDFMIDVAATIASKGPEQREVYQLLPEGSQNIEYVKTLDINPIVIPGYTQDYVNEQNELIRNGEVADQTKFLKEHVSYMFNEQIDLLIDLKSQNFDMLIVERYEDQQFVANFLEIPMLVKVIERVVEPIIIQEIGGNPSHSSQLSTLRNTLFGIQRYETLEDKQLSFFFRFFNFVSFFLHKAYLYPSIQYDLASIIPDEYVEQATTQRYANMTIFTGIEGLIPPIAVPPSLKFIYPRYKTQYQPEFMQIDQELKDFMNKKFPKQLALATFGNTKQPNVYDLDNLATYMVKQKQIGFIVSLSNPQNYPEEVLNKLSESSNIYLTGWVPQQTILKDERVKLFFTHGGLNSYYEGLEASKTMIIIPFEQDEQARFLCDFAHLEQYGSCVYQNTISEIEEAVQRAMKTNGYQKKVSQLSKVAKKSSESKKDLNYWIDYCFKVGTNHLAMPQYQTMRIDQYYDLDLHFLLFTAILVGLYLIYIAIIILIFLVKLLIRFVKYVMVKVKERKAKTDEQQKEQSDNDNKVKND